MHERTQRSLIEAPRWLLLITLVFAPWAYGCTVRWAIDLLNILMGITIGAWLAGCAVRRCWPRLSPVALAAVLLLLCVGWGMAGNPHYRNAPGRFQFIPVTPLVAFAPGTVDQATSLAVMWRISGLLGVFLFVSDFSRRPEWRRRVWWTIGLAGASIVFLGLLQRASGIPLMFPRENQASSTFFGPYYYHGNAGAFINLVLPAIAGLLLLSVRKAVDDFGRMLCVSALLMCLIGAGLCFSRAALAITGLLSIALWVWAMRHLPATIARWQVALYTGLLALTVVGLAAAIGWKPVVDKWRLLGRQLNADNPRLLAASAEWEMVRDAGPFGFGPGTFGVTFPHYTNSLGDAIRGVWRYAHQDYLQTVIEWGWVGAAGWAVVFAGGMVAAVQSLRGSRRLHTEDRTLLFVCVVALCGVAIHALADFPLQIASLQFYVATYLGICWGSGNWEGFIRSDRLTASHQMREREPT